MDHFGLNPSLQFQEREGREERVQEVRQQRGREHRQGRAIQGAHQLQTQL